MLNRMWIVDIDVNTKVGNEIITQGMETSCFGYTQLAHFCKCYCINTAASTLLHSIYTCSKSNSTGYNRILQLTTSGSVSSDLHHQ